jgi:hypothetical protein
MERMVVVVVRHDGGCVFSKVCFAVVQRQQQAFDHDDWGHPSTLWMPWQALGIGTAYPSSHVK